MKNRWKKAGTTVFALALCVLLAGVTACESQTQGGSAGEDAAGAAVEAETADDAVVEAIDETEAKAADEEIDGTGAGAADEEIDGTEDEAADETEEAVQIILSDSGSTVSGEGASVNGNQILISEAGTYKVAGTLSNGQIYVEVSDSDTVTLILDGAELTNPTEPAVYVEEAKKVRIRLAEGSSNLLQSGTSMPSTADENASGGTLFSRDDLTISGSGSLTVNGYINDGIHGNDDLTIKGGTIEVNAVHHAVKANEVLTVEGGTLSLTSGTDGLHSEGDLVVTDGDITIGSGDDGIHADADLTIEDGTIEITNSYEGIEANRIYVTGGEISITASDDGFNAYGGRNNLGMSPGSSENTAAESPELIIDDGTIYVNAGGDGLDSNGDLIVGGGLIVVDGPESSANGALDSGTENGGTCAVNGGTVLAIGASGMAERFGSSSTQASFRVNLTNAAGAGSEILISDAAGNELFSHTSAKSFSSIVFSSPGITVGSDYTVTINGESFTFTQDNITYANSSGSGMGSTPTQPGGSSGGSSSQPGGGSGGSSSQPGGGRR